jgi:hypothetical protein
MKFVLTILLFSISVYCSAQKINFADDYDRLMNQLEKENWSDAESNCKSLLSYAESTDSMEMEQMVLRYIYIYTNAGLLNEQKITKETALKKIKYLKGKVMVMPSHPFNSKCYVNCTHLAEEPNTFFSGVNNSSGTQIFSFEYVRMKDKIEDSIDVLEGKYITLKGELAEIAVEGNILPRFRLMFINGAYRIEE